MQQRYRPDVDGLRAVAVLGVLLFHAGQFSGGFAGVDIFFVISGYLITSLLFVELERSGRIDFVNFWARRTRRILPSALLVLIATVVATYFLSSNLHFVWTAQDASYAALYVINWKQLAASMDYFNEEQRGGFFLHYWSLAVEEQFYLFLTLVFAAALSVWRFIAKGTTWTAGQLAAGLLVGLGLLSFLVNLILATDHQPVAFFGTHARIWELCLGSVVAMLERRGWTPAPHIRSLMAFLGSAAILVPLVTYDAREIAYPGIYATLPTLGAALFLLAGINARGSLLPLPLRLGSMLIPIAIGKLSYALYLWHWPVFLLYQNYFGSWTPMDRAIAMGATLILSIGSYSLVENPIRFSKALAVRPLQCLSAAAAITLLVAGLATTMRIEAESRPIVLANGAVFYLDEVRKDLPREYEDKCHLWEKDVDYAPCIYGRKNSSYRLFLVGDSHAAQWTPAVRWVAEKYGLALYVRTKVSCNFYGEGVSRECEKWRAKVVAEIERTRPDIVIMALFSGERPWRTLSKYQLHNLANAERKTIQRITTAGAQLFMISDTPAFEDNPLDCLFNNRNLESTCRWPLQQSLPSDGFPWSFSRRPPPGVGIIDLSDRFCWDAFCYAANDDVIIMRDTHHITATFSETMGPVFAQRLGSISAISVRAHSFKTEYPGNTTHLD